MAEISTITVPEGKIRDFVDGTFRNDTPEEYVRQNIEKRLIIVEILMNQTTRFRRKYYRAQLSKKSFEN